MSSGPRVSASSAIRVGSACQALAVLSALGNVNDRGSSGTAPPAGLTRVCSKPAASKTSQAWVSSESQSPVGWSAWA